MKILSSRLFSLPLLGLFAGLGVSAVQGCDNAPDIAEQCGLTCDAEAFVNGQASISGVASIDAFFGAALDLDASMRGLSVDMRAELDAIAASVGLEPGASGADISAALDAHLGLYISGGLSIDYQPPACQASVEASLSAAAQCDVEADPGELTVSCSGSCSAEAGVAVDCGAEATLMCEGTAPGLDCSGTCSGSCAAEITGQAECSGTCRGSCDGVDGFEGTCGGMCGGECITDMSAGASCDGRCEGSCEYQAPEGGCEASATASCQAEAGASIECDAGCEGTAEPPSVSAECEASVDAQASASLECTPPALTFGFEFSGQVAGDVMAQAEFRAWLEGFRGHFSALLALRARGEVIADSAVNLSAAASGAVNGAVEELSASGDLSASLGAACALGQLPAAADALTASSGELTGNLTASVEVIGTFGG